MTVLVNNLRRNWHCTNHVQAASRYNASAGSDASATAVCSNSVVRESLTLGGKSGYSDAKISGKKVDGRGIENTLNYKYIRTNLK